MTPDQMLQRDRCVRATLSDLQDQKNSTCRSSEALCGQSKYKAESFSTPWPVSALIDLIGEWYVEPRFHWCLHQGIRPRSLQRNSQAYERLEDNTSLRTLLVRENYLAILMNTAGPTAVKSEEQLAYPLPNLLSDIGGILGLYLGASVLSICELMEAISAFYKKIVVVRAHSQNTKTTNQVSTQVKKCNLETEKTTKQDSVVEDQDEFVIKLPKFKL